MDWIKDAATPTALDVRDDRITFLWMLIITSKPIITPSGLYRRGNIKWDLSAPMQCITGNIIRIMGRDQ